MNPLKQKYFSFFLVIILALPALSQAKESETEIPSQTKDNKTVKSPTKDTKTTTASSKTSPPPNKSFKKSPSISLDFSTSLALGYQSFVYLLDEESSSENFLTLSLLLTYYPCSFLAFTYETGLGIVPSYASSYLTDAHKPYFPTNVSRSSYFNTLQAEFFFYSQSDNIMYFPIGVSFLMLPNLQNTKGDKDIVQNSSKNILYLKLGLGDKFNVFSHTLMDVNFSIWVPFEKISSLTGEGPKEYRNITIAFEIGFGYFG